MKLLLDTHTLLWWLGDEERLGPAARAPIADPTNEVLVSAASLWEIVVKQRAGKLHADIAAIERAAARDGFARLPITPAHLATLAALPQHHRDPFDHLLIAQAMTEGAAFVSQNRHAALYPVQVLPCTGP